jgi:hypothetical protein
MSFVKLFNQLCDSAKCDRPPSRRGGMNEAFTAATYRYDASRHRHSPSRRSARFPGCSSRTRPRRPPSRRRKTTTASRRSRDRDVDANRTVRNDRTPPSAIIRRAGLSSLVDRSRQSASARPPGWSSCTRPRRPPPRRPKTTTASRLEKAPNRGTAALYDCPVDYLQRDTPNRDWFRTTRPDAGAGRWSFAALSDPGQATSRFGGRI